MLETMKLRLGALRRRMLPGGAARRNRGERMEDFRRALEREIARAGRTDRCLSVVLLRVRNRRRHPMAAHRLALLVCRRARATDCIGWVDDFNLGVVLPDTPASGAKQFAESVTGIASARMVRPAYVVHDYPCVSCGGKTDACTLCAAEHRVGNGELARLRQSRPTREHDDDQDNGNGNGNGNGHHGNGNGSGNGHRLGDDHNGNGNGSGHAHAHGDGIASPSGNGNGKVRATSAAVVEGSGSGKGNGNGYPKPSAEAKLESQLQQVFLEGVRSELLGQHPVSAAAPRRLVEELMVRRLPWWKRATDIVGGAVLIKRESPGPVFFKQRRAGLGGKPFIIYKLRTMVNDAEQRKAQLAALNEQDGPAFKLKDDPRTTQIGRFLRRTSLDELPQFWNVLKGDMTLVGPRPLPVPESNACTPWQRRRLCVTPGITCIWQIYGRSRVSFSEWIRMDLRYIREHSWAADLKLLLLTVPAVLARRGAK
jgi:lipopolysaccharide/colanic/teichoic acid biosynthesis glycosyltransferase